MRSRLQTAFDNAAEKIGNAVFPPLETATLAALGSFGLYAAGFTPFEAVEKIVPTVVVAVHGGAALIAAARSAFRQASRRDGRAAQPRYRGQGNRPYGPSSKAARPALAATR